MCILYIAIIEIYVKTHDSESQARPRRIVIYIVRAINILTETLCQR